MNTEFQVGQYVKYIGDIFPEYSGRIGKILNLNFSRFSTHEAMAKVIFFNNCVFNLYQKNLVIVSTDEVLIYRLES